MGSEYYELLMKGLKINDEEEKYKDIHDKIDEMITNSADKMQMLEALICMFEAQVNVGVYFSSVAIAYAVLIGAVAVIPDVWLRIFAIVLLMILALVLAGMSVQINRSIKHKTFVLHALKFRYEQEKMN